MNPSPVLRILQEVDRRVLYALLMLVVMLPFFVTFRIPVPISQETKRLYDAIEALPENSFVLFSIDWGGGTRGENRAQTQAIMRHVMKKKLRFALIAFDPQGKTLGQAIALELQKEFPSYKEGTNWVNFGYKVDQDNYLKGFGGDIPGFVSTDIRGQALSSLPVMEGVRTARDIKILIDVTPSSTYESYIKFLQGPYQVPLGLACTSVMIPEAFNRLDAGQIMGMVGGLKGAVEYEQLLGVVGKAHQVNNSMSAAHLLVILLILIGNVAMLLERRQRARAAGGTA